MTVKVIRNYLVAYLQDLVTRVLILSLIARLTKAEKICEIMYKNTNLRDNHLLAPCVEIFSYRYEFPMIKCCIVLQRTANSIMRSFIKFPLDNNCDQHGKEIHGSSIKTLTLACTLITNCDYSFLII